MTCLTGQGQSWKDDTGHNYTHRDAVASTSTANSKSASQKLTTLVSSLELGLGFGFAHVCRKTPPVECDQQCSTIFNVVSVAVAVVAFEPVKHIVMHFKDV